VGSGTAPPSKTKLPHRSSPTSSSTRNFRVRQSRIEGALAIAEEKGLLKGRKTLVIRGRMPEKLVAEAKRKTGIVSDSKLLQAALANIVAADDYAEWLTSQRGTVDPVIELEF
jgi:hypothetical protein